MDSPQLEQALQLLQQDPLPDDALDRLAVLSDQAPEDEQDHFGDLIESAMLQLGPITPPIPE